MSELVQVTVDRLVHGGQAIGTLESGQKIFVWNALPGETVEARVIKRKKSYLEAIAETIITPSSERVTPQDENYLATSPWQILSLAAENTYKKRITLDVMAHEKVILPACGDTVSVGSEWQYRNKMEYSFWGDDNGLHLALHQRGSHGKQIVTGSALAMPTLDKAARALCSQLQTMKVRAGDLKTAVVRCSQDGTAVAALFVKSPTFPQLSLLPELQGIRVYYSNPKSPASVATERLQELGDCTLHDTLLGQKFEYDVDAFFQVNVPIFERALQQIKDCVQAPTLTDMYAGVGSIGLSVAQKAVKLVELDLPTAAMAGVNARNSSLNTEVIETSAERSLDYISREVPVTLDPPRAGLHSKVTERLLEVLPPQILYLSCNPATQARDLALLQPAYSVEFFEVYNFFPHTPHIESLAVLHRREPMLQ